MHFINMSVERKIIMITMLDTNLIEKNSALNKNK